MRWRSNTAAPPEKTTIRRAIRRRVEISGQPRQPGKQDSRGRRRNRSLLRGLAQSTSTSRSTACLPLALRRRRKSKSWRRAGTTPNNAGSRWRILKPRSKARWTRISEDRRPSSIRLTRAESPSSNSRRLMSNRCRCRPTCNSRPASSSPSSGGKIRRTRTRGISLTSRSSWAVSSATTVCAAPARGFRGSRPRRFIRNCI